jgi:hypothetical protein
MNWDAEAAAVANYVGDNMFEAHRGAMSWRQVGIAVVFGNDCYADDDRTKEEVFLLREALSQVGAKVLGFGVDTSEGYSWAMIVEPPDNVNVPFLNRMIWQISVDLRIHGSAYQAQIALSPLAEQSIRPYYSAN